MSAQWGGTCGKCRVQYHQGATIGYDTDARAVVQCLSCSPEIAGQDPTAQLMGAPASFLCTVRGIKHVGNDGFMIIAVRFSGPPPDVAPVTADRDFSVKGKMPKVALDDTIEVKGAWGRSKYGWEVKATTVVPVVAHTEQALKSFLAKFPHIGPITAAAIVRHFGGRDGTLFVLDHQPERLAEINGITPERAQEISTAYKNAAALREVALWLAELQLGEALSAAILDEWGEHAKDKILEDPYCLMDLPRIGFLKADEVARTKLGIGLHDERRLGAGVLHLLDDQENGFDGGHTYTTELELTGTPAAPAGLQTFRF